MINCQREKFSLSNDTIYLNGAYMSPLLKAVEEVGITGILKKRNPASISPDEFFNETEHLRAAYAQLINVKEPSRIVVTPSVSYGMANVTKNIKLDPGQHIIVAGEQFPSNYYPWKRLCDTYGASLKVVEAPKSLENRGKVWNERLLGAVDKNTKVIALGNVHWADGTLFDLESIRTRATKEGALLIIDGTQSVGALPFDAQKIQPDALICAGYKWLLGPYAMGLSYYGEAFDGGIPAEENWINRLHSEDFAGLVAYEANYQPGALRYEVGEHSNFILVPMMLAAINQICDWGVSNVQEYCKTLIAPHLKAMKNVVIEHENYRAAHLFGIRIPGGDMERMKQALAKANISVSVRGDAIRVSPHVYNTDKEMSKLVEIINANT